MDKKGVSPIPEEEQWKLFLLLISQIAKDKKIEQSEIAEKTGFTQSNMSRMLSCKYKVTLPTFLKLAKAVGVNFFIQSQDDETDLNLAFEKAMEELGRRLNKLPKN